MAYLIALGCHAGGEAAPASPQTSRTTVPSTWPMAAVAASGGDSAAAAMTRSSMSTRCASAASARTPASWAATASAHSRTKLHETYFCCSPIADQA